MYLFHWTSGHICFRRVCADLCSQYEYVKNKNRYKSNFQKKKKKMYKQTWQVCACGFGGENAQQKSSDLIGKPVKERVPRYLFFL